MVDDSCTGHRAFGIALLTAHGIMVSAAMTVVVSTSQDSTSVFLNAVAVVFVADLVSAATPPPPTTGLIGPNVTFHI